MLRLKLKGYISGETGRASGGLNIAHDLDGTEHNGDHVDRGENVDNDLMDTNGFAWSAGYAWGDSYAWNSSYAWTQPQYVPTPGVRGRESAGEL